MKREELETRLKDFACEVITFSENYKTTKERSVLTFQLVRSATSSALNFGEALMAESRNDFVHKMRIVLKELKESQMCIDILKNLDPKQPGLSDIQKECLELLKIFVSSLKTMNQQ